MQITGITEENLEFFAHLFPEEEGDENLIRLGVVDDALSPAAVCEIGIEGDFARLSWLYTDPDCREQGAASMLLNETEKLLDGLELAGIQADFDDEDESMEDFLSERDFLVEESESLYIVPTGDIVYSAGMDRLLEKREKLPAGSTAASLEVRRKFLEFAQKQAIPGWIIRHLTPEYTVVKTDEKGEINGCMILREFGKEDLVIDYFLNPSGSIDVMSLILALYDAIMQGDKTAGQLIFADHEGSAISFIEELTGTAREEYRQKGLYHAVRLF